MRLRIWGVRGSLPTPLSSAQVRAKLLGFAESLSADDLASPERIAAAVDKSEHAWTHGGNTSCVEVSFPEAVFILDAGSGIRGLTSALAHEGRLKETPLHLFFSHFHWDHICGLPFFPPIYTPGRRIDVWSGRSDAERLLALQMNDAHFPVKWKTLPSEIVFHQLHENQSADVAGCEVRIMSMVHPDKAYGFRFDRGGRSVCYITDTEVSKNPNQLAGPYAEFVEGADVVVVDAMYGFLEYHDHYNFGHSSIFTWIDFFAQSRIGELVIFHHDPLADDPAMLRLVDAAQRYRDLVAPQATWKLSAAREGQIWDLDPV